MNTTRILGVVVALLVAAVPASAQGTRTLNISFNDGRVTLVAENVTVREILAEWARKGGSKIVNADTLSGDPVYLTEFQNQPEADVLRTLLRDAPGYGVSMRGVTDVAVSTVDAVYIITAKSSAAPAAASYAAPPPAAAPVYDPALFGDQPNTPQSAPRMIQGSPDDEIPPVRPLAGEQTPSTPERAKTTANPNLRVGPDGTVTSTIPGVIIPVQAAPTTPGTPPTPVVGGRGRGGGGGGGGGGSR
jgi:hypothetical protein